MAFIPDAMIRSAREVSPTARMVAHEYCFRADQESGIVPARFFNRREIRELYNLRSDHLAEVERELAVAGWVGIVDTPEGETVQILKGWVSRSARSKPRQKSTETPSRNPGDDSRKSGDDLPKVGSSSPEIREETPESWEPDSRNPGEISRNPGDELPKSGSAVRINTLLSDQPSEPAHQPGGGDARARAPDPAPDLDEWIAAVEQVTATKRSAGWQMEDRIRRQALALKELGFSPAEVQAVATRAGRSHYRLGFVAEDLAADRQRQTNEQQQSHPHQRPPETAAPQFRARKTI